MSQSDVPERRHEPRAAQQATTFVHRLVGEQAPMLRVQVTDIAEEGVGLLSLIPLSTDDRIALDFANIDSAKRELLLCGVRHCTKSPSGQFRIGVNIVKRQPGSAATTRLPREWFAQS